MVKKKAETKQEQLKTPKNIFYSYGCGFYDDTEELLNFVRENKVKIVSVTFRGDHYTRPYCLIFERKEYQ